MRYRVVNPVPEGYSYYNVVDTESEFGENFILASFFKNLEGAEALATDLCKYLNGDD